MKKTVGVIVFVLIIAFSIEMEAQVWPFRKKSSAERVTKENEKRLRDSGQSTGNAFNKLQPMGSRPMYLREDHIWSSETAYTALPKTGNISVSTPSRLGVHPKLEFQSMLGAFYFAPNLLLKRKWHARDWWWSTRHGIYFPSNGLSWAQRQGYSSVIDTAVTVTQIITVRNELIVSKPFESSFGCVSGQPSLIISAGLSFDYSTTLTDNNILPIDQHILGARSTALIGDGLLIIARIRADYQILDDLYIEGGLKYFKGENNIAKPLEHHAALNYLLTNNISLSPGYILSIGNLGDSNPRIFPFFDITWYFGQKPRRHEGLFKGTR